MSACYIVSADALLSSFFMSLLLCSTSFSCSFIVTSEFDFLEFDLKLGMRMGSLPLTGICIWEILSMESWTPDLTLRKIADGSKLLAASSRKSGSGG